MKKTLLLFYIELLCASLHLQAQSLESNIKERLDDFSAITGLYMQISDVAGWTIFQSTTTERLCKSMQTVHSATNRSRKRIPGPYTVH